MQRILSLTLIIFSHLTGGVTVKNREYKKCCNTFHLDSNCNFSTIFLRRPNTKWSGRLTVHFDCYIKYANRKSSFTRDSRFSSVITYCILFVQWLISLNLWANFKIDSKNFYAFSSSRIFRINRISLNSTMGSVFFKLSYEWHTLKTKFIKWSCFFQTALGWGYIREGKFSRGINSSK